MRNVSLRKTGSFLYDLAVGSFSVVSQPPQVNQYVYSSGKVLSFYEWSDTSRAPLLFFSIDSFTSFLRSSNIEYYPFELDVIRRMLYNPHIACKRGDNRLVICSSKVQLSHVLNNKYLNI